MNSKRKRAGMDDDDDDEDYDTDNSPDAKLARKLQDEENAKGHNPLARRPLNTIASGRPRGNGQGTPQARIPFGVSDDEDELMGEPDPEPEPLTTRLRRRSSRAAAKATPSHGRTLGSTSRTRASDAMDEDLDQDVDRPNATNDSDSALSSVELSVPSPGSSSGFEDDGSDGIDNSDDESGIDLSASDDDDDDDDDDAPPARRRSAVQRPGTGSNTRRRAGKSRNRTTIEDHHPQLVTVWSDLKKMGSIKAGRAEQPTNISRQLKPFQLEGLAWMKAMEASEFKGGILGDEMGLGKTIQAVSLIMSDWPAKQPSLVLLPPIAMMQWMSEIESYTDGTLKTFFFHGTNAKAKNMTVKDLKKYDVIIMSYNSLESMYRKQEKGFKRKDGLVKEESVMHKIHFHRVILDEAHSIKSRVTMTAKACFALNATHRWCLSGTPLQNRVGEFLSLARFLCVRPFAYYFCKKCPCESLEWSMDHEYRCTSCNCASVSHVPVFNKLLLNPIQRHGNWGPGAEAFKNLRLLTDRIMLRRLKKDHTESMELPVKEVYVDRQYFGQEEVDFASSVMTSGQRSFDTYVAQGVVLNNYANIFGLIMQMRQVADHPDLILRKDSAGGQNVLGCCICDEPAEQAIRSKCKHDFCRECAASYLKSSDQPDCPRCHIPLSIDLEQPEIEQDTALIKKSSIINRINMEKWTSSSKIELLVHELHRLRSNNSSEKSIIFSQFTGMLQLIEWRLRRAGITTVMLDGTMTPAQRAASIDYFMKNADVECFLISIKAGGVALNLTEASHVFIVDP